MKKIPAVFVYDPGAGADLEAAVVGPLFHNNFIRAERVVVRRNNELARVEICRPAVISPVNIHLLKTVGHASQLVPI